MNMARNDEPQSTQRNTEMSHRPECEPQSAQRRTEMVSSPEETNRITEAVIGAAIEVHKALGPGFLESIYEEAFCVELSLRGVKYTRQAPVAMDYKGHRIGESRMDLLVEDAVIVELKAVDALAPVHTAQVISYLKATGCRIGLLINFNVKRLTDGIRRIVHD